MSTNTTASTNTAAPGSAAAPRTLAGWNPPTAVTRALTVTTAAAAALAAWSLAGPVSGIDLGVRSGSTVQQVGAGAVLLGALAPGLTGWATLAVMERIWPRRAVGRRVWTVTAVISLLLSMLGPVTSAVDPVGGATLVALHLIVGAVIVYGLRRPEPVRAHAPRRQKVRAHPPRRQKGSPVGRES